MTLLAITGITILNSISIILLAVHAKKAEAENRECEGQTKRPIEDLNRVREEKLGEEIRALQEDLKELHTEISAVKHIPISKKYAMTRTFLKRRRWWTMTEEKEIGEYVAEIALKTIASELPEEERTPEIIEGNIIPEIKKKLNKSSMKL